MLRIMIFAVVAALGVVSVIGQGQKVVCPGMEIKASEESVTRGDKVTFHAVVTGDFDHSKLQYNWRSMPDSALSDGQGTPTVVIDTRNVQKDHNVTVSLEVGPFSDECVTITSQSVRVLAPVSGRAVGPGFSNGPGTAGTGTGASNNAPPAGTLVDVKILSKPRAHQTKEACAAGIFGTVILRVTLLPTGEIGPISVVQGLANGLNEQAVAAAKLIKFEPATRDGKPVKSTKAVEYHFEN